MAALRLSRGATEGLLGSGVARALAFVAAVAVGVGGELAYARTGASAVDLARNLTVGWTLIGVGLIAWHRRPRSMIGRLMVIEGLSWFLGNLQGADVPVLVGVGTCLEALNAAVLAHLILSFPTGRLEPRSSRFVVGVCYGAALLVWIARAAVLGPATGSAMSYLSCHDCGPDGLLLHDAPAVFMAIDLVYRSVDIALTGVVTALVVHRWARSSPPARRLLFTAWLPVLVAAFASVCGAVVVLVPRLPDSLAAPVLWGSEFSQLALPIGFLLSLLRVQLARAAVGDLVVQFAGRPTARELRAELARVLGDPSLRLGIWDEQVRAYRDPSGWLLPPAGHGSATMSVERGGMPLALVVHDASLLETPELLDAASAAVRIGLENSSLRDRITLPPGEGSTVGAWIIEAVDEERRRLERDLHDGAQQRVVSTMMMLGRITARLPGSADPGLRRALAGAQGELRLALQNLRKLAREIYPAVLARDGLEPAVDALAETAELPVVVSIPSGRRSPAVDMTAYLVIAAALANVACSTNVRKVSILGREEGGRLVVEIIHDGARDGVGDLGDVARRVTAVGGALEVMSRPAGWSIRAELPCA